MISTDKLKTYLQHFSEALGLVHKPYYSFLHHSRTKIIWYFKVLYLYYKLKKSNERHIQAKENKNDLQKFISFSPPVMKFLSFL